MSISETVEYKYYVSTSIPLKIQLKPVVMEIPLCTESDRLSDYYVNIQLAYDNVPVYAVSKSVRMHLDSEGIISQDETIVLPIKYRDLLKGTTLLLDIYRNNSEIVAHGILPLFDDHSKLRTGYIKVRLLPHRYPDLNKCVITNDPYECVRIAQDSFESRPMNQSATWLDTIVSKRLHTLIDEERKYSSEMIKTLSDLSDIDPLISRKEDMSITIQFPSFPYPVIFEEPTYGDTIVTKHLGNGWIEYKDIRSDRNIYMNPKTNDIQNIYPETAFKSESDLTGAIIPNNSENNNNINTTTKYYNENLFIINDPTVEENNPAEKRAHKVARGKLSQNSSTDKNLKPNLKEKTELMNIINNPKSRKDLKEEEQLLIWKFRYYLIDYKKGLEKFLYCVDFNDENEVKEAISLLYQWRFVDIDDALVLLTDEFRNEIIREYAIKIIEKSSDEQLLWFLLQLVQALRYEPNLQGDRLPRNIEDYKIELCPTPLGKFLITRSSQSLEIANYFHWYLMVAMEDKKYSELYEYIHSLFLKTLDETDIGRSINSSLMLQQEFVGKLFSLALKLQESGGKAAKKTPKLIELMETEIDLNYPKGVCFPLLPSLYVTGVNTKTAKVFKSALSPFSLHFLVDSNRLPVDLGLSYFSDNSKETDKCCDCEMKFNFCMCTKCKICDKIVMITDRHHCRLCGCTLCDDHFNKEKKICSDIEVCYIFRKPSFPVMVKLGDDVRQDQLVIQMITLIDQLLKNVNLNLHLTPYRVIAINSNEGLLEFVRHSQPVSSIENFQTHLRKYNPDPNGEFGISPKAMDVYIRSCAGYCVINYLLSIGDRHLDNIMLCEDGHLFHIDFGYVFGHDPKMKNPVAMRLTKEMIEGMGGATSNNYNNFKRFCSQAFLELRKRATLLINLLRLMLDAGVHDLTPTSLRKIEDRFRLDLSEEDAESLIYGIIDESVNAILPGVLEAFHALVRDVAR